MALREDRHGVDGGAFERLFERIDDLHAEFRAVFFRALAQKIAHIDLFNQRMRLEQRHEIGRELAAADKADSEFSAHFHNSSVLIDDLP